MKKKVKRYDEGGVLRDSSGNPVRSGSGEVVRTRFGGRRYDEDAPASMTESSDYSGRRKSVASPDVESSFTENLPAQVSMEEEAPRKISDYIRSGPKEDVSSVEVSEEKVKVSKPKPKPKAKSATEVAREIGKGYMKAAEAAKPAKKEPMYDLAKAGRALADTFSSERATKRYAESTPYARSKMGMKSGGKVSSASSRADGIAQRGKTKGRIC